METINGNIRTQTYICSKCNMKAEVTTHINVTGYTQEELEDRMCSECSKTIYN